MTGIGPDWCAAAATSGSAGTGRSRGALGQRRRGTRWPGRSSAAPMSVPWSSWPPGCARPVGDVLLILAAGAQLSAYIGATVGEIGFLRGIWLDGSRRLVWLEDYAASLTARPTSTCPIGSPTGSGCEECRFAYPGTDRLVLDDINLHLPAGAVVAIVGENGAGKSTLVKLLCQAVPADGRADPGGRPAAGPDARRRLAREGGRRVPGFLPLRVRRRAQRRARRPAAGRRRRGGRDAVERAGPTT